MWPVLPQPVGGGVEGWADWGMQIPRQVRKEEDLHAGACLSPSTSLPEWGFNLKCLMGCH